MVATVEQWVMALRGRACMLCPSTGRTAKCCAALG